MNATTAFKKSTSILIVSPWVKFQPYILKDIYNKIACSYIWLIKIGIVMIPTCWITVLTTWIGIILIDCIDTFIDATSTIVEIIVFYNVFDTYSKANRSFIILYLIYFEGNCSIYWSEWILR